MMKSNVKRVFPGPVNGLIKWMEDNFYEIDGFVSIFNLKDGTTMTVYDAYTYVQAVGLAEVAKDTIHELSHNEEFIPKTHHSGDLARIVKKMLDDDAKHINR